MHCLKKGYKDIVQFLLEQDLPLSGDLQDKNGNTIVMIALENPFWSDQIVEKLITFTSNIGLLKYFVSHLLFFIFCFFFAEIKNKKGKSAIDLAQSQTRTSVVETMLKKKGGVLSPRR